MVAMTAWLLTGHLLGGNSPLTTARAKSAHPAFPQPPQLAFGQKFQNQADAWVNFNFEQFGGDPDYCPENQSDHCQRNDTE